MIGCKRSPVWVNCWIEDLSYCLRTNIPDGSEQQLWTTYSMLTEIEATFRSLKTELGLRPVYHQKQDCITSHLFITLLAYHRVHTLRCQLKH
jgi:transposase